MKINAKPFKTWEEQLEILNKRGNNFLDKNPEDKEAVLDYLKSNNFQVCVDSFAPLLWKNFDDGVSERNVNYIDDFKFSDLEELFNFDNSLKNSINELLQNLERKLKTGIIYHTLKALKLIFNNKIDFPFILFDDNWSQIIGESLFNNNLSHQSFSRNGKFQFQEYYSFLTKYLEPFDLGSLFAKNADLKRFYFGKVLENDEKLEKCRNFDQYKVNSKNNQLNLIPLEMEDLTSHTINCTFNEFFKWCLSNKFVKNTGEDNETSSKNKVIRGMINVLAKSFVPLYKSFTQEALGDIIKFFSKLSENIQVDIIEDHFPLFYQKVTGLIQNDKDSNLILIGTFISLLDVFKNLRNKIAHLDIAYNFWDLHNSKNSSAGKSVPIKENEFWIVNKSTCIFLNNQLKSINENFCSNYFKDKFIGKSSLDYLNRINDLKIKVYCKYKDGSISFVNKSDEPNLWHLPIFFLRDAVAWLCIFTKNKKDFKEIVNQCFLENNVNNIELKNRVLDYLFNKIIISFDKIRMDE